MTDLFPVVRVLEVRAHLDLRLPPCASSDPCGLEALLRKTNSV
jgi:hypothetical protein